MSKPQEAPSHAENYEATSEATGSKRSCCLTGCLLMLLAIVLVVGVGGFLGYRWLQNQLDRYTSDTPADLPTVELPAEELAEIEKRVETFQETLEKNEPTEDLVLTAEEINALITKDDDMRGRVFVRIDEGQVSGDVSIPTDFLPGGKGRFFNASASFDVSLENGVLIVTLTGAEVKGEQVPPQFIEGMSKENLAKELYKDPEVAATLRRIKSVTIEDDRIVLKPETVASSDGETEGDDQSDAAPAATTAEGANPAKSGPAESANDGTGATEATQPEPTKATTEVDDAGEADAASGAAGSSERAEPTGTARAATTGAPE